MEIYNSRDLRYKSVFRALKTEETATFRICLPIRMGCSGARLVIHKDYEENKCIYMQWDRDEEIGDERYHWWKCEFSSPGAGLFWYHFEYDLPWQKMTLTKGYAGIGQTAWGGSDWQLTVYDKDFKTPDWIKGGLIYQIFPDRFNVGGEVLNPYGEERIIREDKSGEPYWKPVEGYVLNNDYFAGNLKGIEEKLDYLKSMGVSCIYLNPIFEAHANHRYNTADYMKVDGMLGDEKSLKHLCDKAKSKGIRIILDGVFSHVGEDSIYFNKHRRYGEDGAYNSKDSKYYNWFNFKNWPEEYAAWWGIKLLPEVNETNEDYLEFICGENGVARKWLRCGVSGWRLDVADELPDIFLDRLRTAVKEENPDAYILGEVWEDATNKFAYNVRRRYLLGEQLDSVMNYPFANSILSFVKNGGTAQFMNTVLDIIENYPEESLHTLMNHIGTHDTVRALTAIGGEDSTGKDRYWQSGRKLTAQERANAKKLLYLATLIQFTLPGVPSIYYGDEAGMEGYSDPFNRFFFPWDNIDFEICNWYKRLGKLRSICTPLKKGDFVPVSTEEGILAYERRDGDNAVLVAVNRTDSVYSFTVDKKWNGATAFLGTIAEKGEVNLEPNGFCLLGIGDWV